MTMKRAKHPLTSLWVGVPLWSIAIVFSMIFSDCTRDRNQATAVPLPPAYPRIELYDTVRKAISEAEPLIFRANAATTVTAVHRNDIHSRWINIAYPRYKAVMYCTFTPVTDHNRDRVIDNRTERMSLNTGGRPTEIITLESPGGFHSQLLVTQTESVTPLQFLSTDGERWVVSGAVYLENAPRAAASDSIAPVIDALRDDVIDALANLKER